MRNKLGVCVCEKVCTIMPEISLKIRVLCIVEVSLK